MAQRPHLIVTDLYNPPELRQYHGGGGGTYQRTQIQRHANKIYREAEQLKEIISTVQQALHVRRMHYRVELPEEINAWTTQGDKLEKSIHATIVGSPEPSVTHVSTTEQSFDLLFEELKRYKNTESHVGKVKFAPIESVGLIPAEEKISLRLKGALDDPRFLGEVLFALFPDLLREDQAAYRAAIEAFLTGNNGTIEGIKESDVGLLLRVKASAATVKACASNFMGIYSVDPLDGIVIRASTRGPTLTNTIEVLPNDSNARAAVFDSGVVTGCRFLDSSILGHENPMGLPHDEDHGTFVISRIVYGDTIIDQMSGGRLTPDVKALSVCVFPKDDLGQPILPKEDDLVSIIRDTVERWHREIKVYNLSLNLELRTPHAIQTVTDDTVSPLAAEMDHLARKFGVLFIVTTGNYVPSATPRKPYPKYFEEDETRILPPAEAMLALTVGSLSQKENAGSLSKAKWPSPFTRKGPGFQSFRKPDLIAHGGNLTSTWQHLNDLATVGISSDGTSIAYDNGTSFVLL